MIDRALAEFVRRIKARRILGLAGSGVWEGNLEAACRFPPARSPTPEAQRPC